MSKKISVLIDNLTSFERQLIAGIVGYAHLHGPWIFYKLPAFFMPHRQGKKLLQEIKKFDPDGIIMREMPFSQEIFRLGKPTILSPYSHNHFPEFITVIGDDAAIGAAAAEHLLEKGLRHFAYCGLDDMFWSSGRRDGFCRRIKQAGMNVIVYQQPKSKIKRFWENEKTIVADWLMSLPRPVGLMGCIDHRCEQIAQLCQEKGIHIPEEVAVIGVNNDTQICELTSPPLSSVVLNDKMSGFLMAQLLDRLIAGKSVPRENVCTQPVYVVQRQSTDIIAVNDGDVAGAVRFIRNYLRKNISVADVTRAAAVPRRTLERKFQKNLRRTIHQAITHERIKLAEQILVTTRLPIAQIAAQVGYSSNGELIRNFKKVKQTTPLAYRKQYALIS